MSPSRQKKEILSENQISDKLVKELRDKIRGLETQHKEQQAHIQALEEKIRDFPDLTKFSPEKLRQELIEGIRLLGERVTEAVQEINQRHEKFSAEIAEKFAEIQNSEEKKDAPPEEAADSEFGTLKENRLLNEDDYEIVRRDAIERLIELSRQQAAAVKTTVRELAQKVATLEEKIETLPPAAENSSSNGNGKQTPLATILSVIALLAAIIALAYQLF